jgi:hypothetical protein
MTWSSYKDSRSKPAAGPYTRSHYAHTFLVRQLNLLAIRSMYLIFNHPVTAKWPVTTIARSLPSNVRITLQAMNIESSGEPVSLILLTATDAASALRLFACVHLQPLIRSPTLIIGTNSPTNMAALRILHFRYT